jgi:APA family basic amino acid/polyamine antiporter
MLSCVWLMAAMPGVTWRRFVIWLGVGLVFYFRYGFWRSKLRNSPQEQDHN